MIPETEEYKSMRLAATLQALQGVGRDDIVEKQIKPLADQAEGREKDLEKLRARRGEDVEALKNLLAQHQALISDWQGVVEKANLISLQTGFAWTKTWGGIFLGASVVGLVASVAAVVGQVGETAVWLIAFVSTAAGVPAAVGFWVQLKARQTSIRAFRHSFVRLKKREAELLKQFSVNEDALKASQGQDDPVLSNIRAQLQLTRSALEAGYADGMALKGKS